MERFYKICEPCLYIDQTNKADNYTLCVNQTIKTMPFNVWRDVSRKCYKSTELSGLDCGYSIYYFPTKDSLDKAVAVLNGALFKEVTSEEWQKWRDGPEED